MRVTIPKCVFNPRFYPYLRDRTHRYPVSYTHLTLPTIA